MLCFQSPVATHVEVAVPEPEIIQVHLYYISTYGIKLNSLLSTI